MDSQTKSLKDECFYTAFGVESAPLKINPWRYLSKCKEPETGFIFFGRRYYDPAVGRWMTADPKGYTDSMNLYTFALNDPFMLIDPYGLENEALQKISSAGAFTLNNAGQGFCHPIDTLRSFSGDIQGFGQAALAWNFSSYSAAWQSMTWEERFQLFASKGLQAGGLALAVASIPRTAVCHGAGLIAAETRAGFSYITSRFFTRQTLPTEFILNMSAFKYAVRASAQGTAVALKEPSTYYSVALETKLSPTSYPGISRASHFQEANEHLLQMMEKDKHFAEMMRELGIQIDRTPTGLAPRSSPSGWTWHHSQKTGILQLVPRSQHTPGSIYWDTMHKGGKEGYAIWGQ